MHEASGHEQNSYLTLTYDAEHVPADGGLVVSHLQAFWRALRKRVSPRKVRYYAVGEYGDINRRPHYHAIVFGHTFPRDGYVRTGDAPLWRCDWLSKDVWKRGHVTVGNVNRESIAYVSRYAMKKVLGTTAQSEDERDARYGRYDPDSGLFWRVPSEFAVMSRRPGIGSDWFDEFRGDVFPSDEVVINGRVERPPRYYDEKLSDEELDLVKARRKERLNKDEVTPERLAVREMVANAKASRFGRSL